MVASCDCMRDQSGASHAGITPSRYAVLIDTLPWCNMTHRSRTLSAVPKMRSSRVSPVREVRADAGRRRHARLGARAASSSTRPLVHRAGHDVLAAGHRARQAAAAHGAVGGRHLVVDRGQPHAGARSAGAAGRRAAGADLPPGRHHRGAGAHVADRGGPLRAQHARMRQPRAAGADDHAPSSWPSSAASSSASAPPSPAAQTTSSRSSTS